MKLSETQLRAMGKLHSVAFLSAYELKESLSTLHSLANKELAVTKYESGYLFSPRTAICFRLAPGIDPLDYLETNY